jgi:hypothetical protein
MLAQLAIDGEKLKEAMHIIDLAGIDRPPYLPKSCGCGRRGRSRDNGVMRKANT